MKKLLVIGMLSLGLGCSYNAIAGTYSGIGKTTCYTFKKDKLVDKAKCDIYVLEGANSMYPRYDFSNYIVKTPKTIVRVINSNPCESENRCKNTHTINGKKAKLAYRSTATGHKILKDAEVNKMSHEQLIKQALICDKMLDGKLEICTPYTKETRMQDEPPAWAKSIMDF